MPVTTQATRIAQAQAFFDQFPQGWWVSLYGFETHDDRRWTWTGWRPRREVVEVVEYDGGRVELSPRIRVPIRLDGAKIIVDNPQLTFRHLDRGLYDHVGVHATVDGEVYDMGPIAPVTLSEPGQLPDGQPVLHQITTNLDGWEAH